MTMCKINLSTGEVRPTIDLDALLEDDGDGFVATNDVATRADFVATNDGRVATNIPSHVATNQKIVATNSRRVATKELTETVRFRARARTGELLKREAEARGFENMSALVRSALKYALKQSNFKEGWDDRWKK